MRLSIEGVLDNPENNRRSYQHYYPPDRCLQRPTGERKNTPSLFRYQLWTQDYQHRTNNPIENNHAFRHQAMWTETDQRPFKIEDNHPPEKHKVEEAALFPANSSG